MHHARNAILAIGLLVLLPTLSAQAAPTFDDGFVVINLQNEVNSQSGKKPAKVDYSPSMRLRVFGADQGDALKINGARAKRHWSNAVDRVLKGKAIHSPRFQVVGSDLLGMAYAWTQAPKDIEPFGNVYFYFWASLANDRSNYPDPSWRCKLNGKSVRKMNVDGHRALESISRIKQQDDQMRGRKRESKWYGWHLMWIKPQLIWGKERNPKAPSTVSNTRYNISQHPGSYVCRLRNAGETVREFSFTVSDNGLLARHGAQGDDGVTLRPGAHFVDMKIVPNKAEHSFDAKAAKRSVAFGRPWRKAPDIKAHTKRFPKSYGAAVPKKPRGAR